MQAKEKLGKTVTIRTEPRAVSGNSTNLAIQPYATVDYMDIVPDMDYPTDDTRQWLHLGDNRYANYWYPPNGQRFDLLDAPSTDPANDLHLEIDISGNIANVTLWGQTQTYIKP